MVYRYVHYLNLCYYKMALKFWSNQADSETGPELSVYELHDFNGGQDVLIMLLTKIYTLKMVITFGHAQAFYQVCKRQAVRGVVYNY
ncbi:hypothetical protein Hdeb2414_s0095g00791681 [Helianthus debilis subsp. tardiflorus]